MEIINYCFESHKQLAENFIKNNISSLDHEIIILDKIVSNTFLILENKQLLAFTPLYFELDKTGDKHGRLFNLSIPGPIISDDVTNKKFKKIINLIFDEINKRCLKDNVKSIKINFDSLTKSDLNSQKSLILLENLIQKGFVNKSFLSLRLNLKERIENIANHFSKGHKAEIKKQSKKKYYFKTYADEKLNLNKFREMMVGHFDFAEYIDSLYKIYKKNKIILVYEDESAKFSAMFSLINDTVEYLIDNKFIKNHHSLVFESIKYFKNLDHLKYFNFGIISFLYNLDIEYSKKKENTAIFKKGFGGEKYLFSVFEKKYF